MSTVAAGREGVVRHRRGKHADSASVGAASLDRQPRLVLRFALVTAIGLALAGALILAVIREIDQRQAVRAATDRAHFVSETFLRRAIEPADADGPVSSARREELDRLIRQYVLIDGALRVSIVGAGDRITYSTDHRLIGTVASDRAEIAEVRNGAILSRVADVQAGDRTGTVKALVSSVPVALGRGTVAVISTEQDYASVAASARESLLPVAGVLEAVLVLLFVLLLPALARASRKLREYVAELHYQARHDVLTGLSNRIALYDNLSRALAELQEGEHVAVLLIDLDRFKEVNDSLGHDAGDELLQDIAARLVEVSGDASVSRLGGDEFSIVLAGATPREALDLGHALRSSIEAPMLVRNIPVSVDASIGIALAPEDGVDVSQLVRRADVAMYAAKLGRAGVVRYSSEDDRNDANKLALMTELRKAVEYGELEVHYQPIVAAGSGSLEKVEALVRWRHPSKGLLQPGAFIPLAEHTRLIIELNGFVLREAVRQCEIWRRRGIELGVTVNVAVIDLLEPSFSAGIETALRAAGLPPSALTIEITEGAFVQEPARVRRTLERLRTVGVKVAIDDFGTGYSSLSYLRDLPVDVLKIDRSFISGLPADGGNKAIVAATIELAHRLGLSVVAEGVETAEQYELLVELGCDLIQGYVVSKPVSASTLGPLMDGLRGGREAAA